MTLPPSKIRFLRHFLTFGAPVLVLSACGNPVGDTQQTDTRETSAAPAPPADSTPPVAPPPAPAGSSNPVVSPTMGSDAASLVPAAEKGEAGARNILLTWARALENGDYDTAYAQWGDAGARSGLSRTAHAEQWGQYRTITIAMPTGTMDGGAGSLYYEAPTVVTGTTKAGNPFRLSGTVVLRRVNDVDGATAAQLRWHIESANLLPA